MTSRPRTPSARLAAVAATGAALFAIGVITDAWTLRMIAKPLPVLALIAWLRAAAPASRYRTWIVAGLVASLAGDVLLEASPSRLFVAGLVAFLVAHVLYVVAYVSSSRAPAALRAVPAYAYGVGVLALLWPGLGAMRAPVALYTAVICTMLWRAAARVGAPGIAAASARAAMLGAISFAISDTMIATGRFGAALLEEDVRTGWPWRWAIMALYWLGQWGIARSAVRASRR